MQQENDRLRARTFQLELERGDHLVGAEYGPDTNQ
jgi:hypothetical protein